MYKLNEFINIFKIKYIPNFYKMESNLVEISLDTAEVLSEVGLPIINDKNQIYFLPSEGTLETISYQNINYLVIGNPNYHDFDDSKICISQNDNCIYWIEKDINFCQFVNSSIENFISFSVLFYNFYCGSDLLLENRGFSSAIIENKAILESNLFEIDPKSFDKENRFWIERLIEINLVYSDVFHRS